MEDFGIETVLAARGPRSDLAEQLEVFAPLIGSWILEVENIKPDGSVHVTDGEWHFDWALDGRAVVDVWLSPARTTRAADQLDGEWGMTVRFFDPTIEAFRSTWHGPLRGLVIPFIGRPTTDGFALEGRRDDIVMRWVFSKLTPDSFDWRAEETEPGETVPRVRQRFRARRQE